MQQGKVRILSFQNAYNYGAILQAYGLQETVKRLGFKDVEFINYFPGYLKDHYSLFPKDWFVPKKKTIRGIISHYINLPFILINKYSRYKSLDGSRKRMLKQSGIELNKIEDFGSIECNYLICGSDQIWSTWITGTPDPVFYALGNYVGLTCALAYAPSTELSTFDDETTVQSIKGLLENFKFLSVREEPVQKKIIELTGRDVHLCVDPTILCGVDSFEKISSKRKVKKDYILLYNYGETPLVSEAIKKIANHEKYEIHSVTFGASGRWSMSSRNVHSVVSVEDFLSYFLYASYVITNSFHGLAFSLLFKRDFLVIYEKGKSTRCESLLHQVGCDNRLVKKVDDISWDRIDYDSVSSKLVSMQKDSEDYLNKCLNYNE